MTNKYFEREINHYIDSFFETCKKNILSGEDDYDYCDKFYVDAFAVRCLGVIHYLDNKNFESKNTNWKLDEAVIEAMTKVGKLKNDLFNLNWDTNWEKQYLK